MSRFSKLILFSTVSLLLTVAVFHAAACFGLINCDDYDYLLNHPEVTGGLSVSGIRWAFANMQEAIWMPLTWLSYMTDYSLGLGFGGMHWISILLHGLNAALLFILLSRLFSKHSTIFILAATLTGPSIPCASKASFGSPAARTFSQPSSSFSLFSSGRAVRPGMFFSPCFSFFVAQRQSHRS